MKIQPVVFDFLSQLEQNNNREWFAANRTFYEESLAIVSQFVNALIEKIAEFDTSVSRETAKTSLFRIYRDIRFSPNKTPYKNYIGVYIAKGGRSSKYAGYYLRFQNNQSLVGGGLWRPEREILSKIREDIYYSPEEISSIIFQKELKKTYGDLINQDKLIRAPKGYPTDFEYIELIKNKHYMFEKTVTNSEVLHENFLCHLTDLYRLLYPFNQYLNSIIQYEE